MRSKQKAKSQLFLHIQHWWNSQAHWKVYDTSGHDKSSICTTL